jgi:hypothetical protein
VSLRGGESVIPHVFLVNRLHVCYDSRSSLDSERRVDG